MIQYPGFDPVFLSLGPLQFRWYGMMYVLGFLGGWWLARVRARRPGSGWSGEQVEDLVTWGILGVVLGGRLGYVLFYDLAYYLEHPTEILSIWAGGMSFHGGLLGVLVALWFYARRHDRFFLDVVDFMAPLVPPGLFFGRIGNFINSEHWGTVTDVPWGMVFPNGGALPRHPSQLYEAGLEGILLFSLLWCYAAKPRKRGAVSGMFAFLYGIFRFSSEFVREPDAHLGYLAFGWLTIGQILCLPLIIAGLWLLLRTPAPQATRRKRG